MEKGERRSFLYRIEFLKRRWRECDPHHFMDKAALMERKKYMRRVKVAELKECLLRMIRWKRNKDILVL